MIVLMCFISRFKSHLWGMKCEFKHHDLQMIGRKLDKLA